LRTANLVIFIFHTKMYFSTQLLLLRNKSNFITICV
jgi:hypothetical protein